MPCLRARIHLKDPLTGLIAELLSGTAFTAKRHENLRTWTYRIHPSVMHGKFERVKINGVETAPLPNDFVSPPTSLESAACIE